MPNRNRSRALLALGLFVLVMLPPVPVTAHEGATGVVKERMDAMDAMAKAMKALAPIIRGIVPYDAERVRAAANGIKQESGAHLLRLFPEGSLQPPSVAKAEIWRDWAHFSSLAENLADAAGELLDAARPDGPAVGFQSAFRAVARNCVTCHKDYRTKK